MIIIDKDFNIKMTKGDTFLKSIILKKGDQAYNPDPEDRIRFALSNVYKGEKGYNLLIEKIIPNDSLQWRIDPEDTNDLKYGSYVYDLQITYADGKVETFADKKRFVLTEEVE